MLFNLLASLVTAVAAPMIIDLALKVGMTLQHGYLVVAALFGGIAIIPFVVIFATLKEKPLPPLENVPHITLKETIKIFFSNMPFRYATGIYILNWISFDIVALMLPYFLLYWIAQGDLLYQVNLFGINFLSKVLPWGF